MVGMNHAKLAVENLQWRTYSVGIATFEKSVGSVSRFGDENNVFFVGKNVKF
tara:strand:- start:130 stop:285 length:156 start_codon:yes stop_codon:yes gene_type:complete